MTNTLNEPHQPKDFDSYREECRARLRDAIPAPRYKPQAMSQQFQDLYTDGAGHCFSDADEGL